MTDTTLLYLSVPPPVFLVKCFLICSPVKGSWVGITSATSAFQCLGWDVFWRIPGLFRHPFLLNHLLYSALQLCRRNVPRDHYEANNCIVRCTVSHRRRGDMRGSKRDVQGHACCFKGGPGQRRRQTLSVRIFPCVRRAKD